jgi:hypothetical protein
VNLDVAGKEVSQILKQLWPMPALGVARIVHVAQVVAAARAWQWQQELESGQYSSIGELAEANQVDRTYVSRLLQLTSLAPDLVESLLAGNDCEGLSLRQLRKGIPMLWSQQRESFGS